MAATETIKWIAVPNGYDSSGDLLLSVILAPELSGGPTGTLADFPDFQNWPQTLSAQLATSIGWAVNFTSADGSVRAAANVAFSAPTLSQALWTTLFGSSVTYGPADPAQARFRSIAVASYPAGHVGNFLLGQYQSYAPDAVPTLQTLHSVYGSIADVLVGVTPGASNAVGANAHFERLAADRAARSQNGTVPHANDFSTATPADAFAAQAYYHLPGAGAQPAPGIEPVDFHKALTFVGQHGILQRALGLVFDLTIPVAQVSGYSGLFGSGVADVFVSVTLGNVDIHFKPAGGVTYTEIAPRTHCNGSTTVFEAHPATANIAAGRQLAVGAPTLYNAHVVDLDGAGLRASSFATQVQLAQAPATIKPEYATSFRAPNLASTLLAPPSMRSTGLTLTETNRGVNFAAALGRAFLLLDATTAFVQNPRASQIPDLTAEDLLRGYVLDVLDAAGNVWRSTAERLSSYSAGSTTVPASQPSSAPFDEAAMQAPPRTQTSPSDESAQQANLSEVILRYDGWSNAAPRPGTVLQDADSQAGGSTPNGPFSQLTIQVQVPPGRLPPLRFGHTYALRARIVDVANNVIPLTAGANVGDGLGRVTTPMVYGRHEPIGAPDLYLQSSPRLAESLRRLVVRDVDGAATSMRALAPQRCAQTFAEWHGMFDSGGALDPSSYGSGSQSIYTLIASRESARYPEPSTPPAAIALTSSVPYLPDPLAKGGLLTVTDGALAGNGYAFAFSPAPGSWPDYLPFGLRLVPGSGQSAGIDQTGRVLSLTLGPADTVTAQITSTCDVADIALLALPSLFPAGSVNAAQAAAGRYWAITPAVALELIYAVQKPLLTPEFPVLPTPPRALGDTFATIAGELQWSPKSTSKVDLLADWGDPVDDPVHGLPVQGPGAPNPAPRQTANAPVATLPSATSPLASAGGQAANAADAFSVRHEFFDTKHRSVTYHAVATSRFTEFYAPGTDVTVRTSNPVVVDILSTARPDTPKIAAVVPIYGWKSRTEGSDRTLSERSPSGLRVFIERPWWSTGIGELLGVVTWPGAEPVVRRPLHSTAPVVAHGRGRRAEISAPGAAAVPIPGDVAPYVTDWGADPVFKSTPLPSLHPRTSSFPNATATGVALSIDESAAITVNVAGHPVSFDPDRNLWFCDVAVDSGATYTPMIRLALARFQPSSIAGAELSRIVLADIMSLEPGRTAAVVRHGAKRLESVALTGYSYSQAAGDRGLAPGVAEVVIERRVAAIDDDTLGWEQVGNPIPMSVVRVVSRRGVSSPATTWVARGIELPHGTLRLSINQYELLPTDNRERSRGFYVLAEPSRELRLLYQDLIPL